MKSKSSSWKQKVDPAFDRFINLILELLEAVKLPANEGYICIAREDQHFRLLEAEGFPDFKNQYETKNPYDDLNSFLQGMLGKFSGDEKPLDDLQDFIKDFITAWVALFQRDEPTVKGIVEKILGNLDEESRTYYVKSFTRVKSQTDSVYAKCLISNMLSLFCHRFLCVADRIRDTVKGLNPSLLQDILFNIWNTASVAINGKPLKTLYNEAMAGNNSSLFKIIQIDKTLFDHDWVREQIRRALYSGDREFFMSLSKAIGSDPLNNRMKRIKEFLILTLFWEVGLYRLSVPDLLELFNDCGLANKDDEITFRKFRDRFVKKRPKLLKISNLF